jgi:hypothetical protein
MFKRFLVIGAVVLAACGTGSSGSNASTDPGGGTNPPGFGPNVPTIPIGAVVTPNPAAVKVVLNTTQTVWALDCGSVDGEGTCVAIPCTSIAQCPGPNRMCAPTSECMTSTEVPTILYVKNLTASPYGFAVPCDGRAYTAEVYVTATTAATGPKAIAEAYISGSFTMPTTVPNVACAAPVVPWNPVPSRYNVPALVCPTAIFAGFTDPPYSTFRVAVAGLNSPWATNGWTVSYAGQPTAPAAVYGGASVTLPSPTSATGAPLSFTSVFNLASNRLLPGESATPWQATVGPVANCPIPSGAATVTPP